MDTKELGFFESMKRKLLKGKKELDITNDKYPTYHIRYHGSLIPNSIIKIPENVTLMIPYCCGFINVENNIQAMDLAFNSEYYRNMSGNILTIRGKKYIKLQPGMEMCDLSLDISKDIGYMGIMNGEQLISKHINTHVLRKDQPIHISEDTLILSIMLNKILYSNLPEPNKKDIYLTEKTEKNNRHMEFKKLIPDNFIIKIFLYYCGKKYFDYYYRLNDNINDVLIICFMNILDDIMQKADTENLPLPIFICNYILNNQSIWDHPEIKLEDYPFEASNLTINNEQIIKNVNFASNFFGSIFYELFELEYASEIEKNFYKEIVIPKNGPIRLSDVVNYMHKEYPLGVFLVNISCQGVKDEDSICMISRCIDKLIRVELNGPNYKLIREIFTETDIEKMCKILDMYPVKGLEITNIERRLINVINSGCTDQIVNTFTYQLYKKHPNLYEYLLRFMKHFSVINNNIIIVILNDYITDKYNEEKDHNKRLYISSIMGKLKRI
jgi:hypothetical protein|uniref:Uncharacterized protein n=1 Tax=viral metagenome TaxID=1070528 RepID=A0A6C0M2K3_9ZZZZ